MDVALQDHGPEVVDSVGERTLGRDVEPLAVADRGGDVARVHVTELVVLLVGDLHPVLIIGNNVFEPISCDVFRKIRNSNIAFSFLLRNSLKLFDHLSLCKFCLQVIAERFSWYFSWHSECIITNVAVRQNIRP